MLIPFCPTVSQTPTPSAGVSTETATTGASQHLLAPLTPLQDMRYEELTFHSQEELSTDSYQLSGALPHTATAQDTA